MHYICVNGICAWVPDADASIHLANDGKLTITIPEPHATTLMQGFQAEKLQQPAEESGEQDSI